VLHPASNSVHRHRKKMFSTLRNRQDLLWRTTLWPMPSYRAHRMSQVRTFIDMGNFSFNIYLSKWFSWQRESSSSRRRMKTDPSDAEMIKMTKRDYEQLVRDHERSKRQPGFSMRVLRYGSIAVIAYLVGIATAAETVIKASSGEVDPDEFGPVQLALLATIVKFGKSEEETEEKVDSLMTRLEALSELAGVLRDASAQETVFNRGAYVRVSSDVQRVKAASEGHGGWAPGMEAFCGREGRVLFQRGGRVLVKFDDRHWTVNAEVLTLIHGLTFKARDRVRVIDDVDGVKTLSQGHGGWTSRMASYCGKVGIVDRVDSDGDVRVQFSDGRGFFYNPQALEKF